MQVPKAEITEASSEIELCLRGEKLYGDDFSLPKIEAWFRDEEEGYYNLAKKERSTYVYGYHALNWLHGYTALPKTSFYHILGVGSAFGEEMRPIARRASRITILEASERFRVQTIDGVSVEYVRPNSNGQIPFPENMFDLVTCLSVLHHIPNVSTVLREVYRCTTPGGFVLLREPIVSLGDWRKPRRGLTKRERGIPLHILRDSIKAAGFEILRQRKCMFPLIRRLQRIKSSPVFNSPICTIADYLICCLPIWPQTYHAKHVLEKLRPNAIFYVLRKRSSCQKLW